MKYLIYAITIMSLNISSILFDFNKNADLKNWAIINDAVMGGKSEGNFSLNKDGHGVFEGFISLKNNGGFSMLRYVFKKKALQKYSKIRLKFKGDGKTYQFRIKSNSTDYYSYTTSFSTSGAWQEIEISLKDMAPSFRGRKLDQPNFPGDHMEEIAFLIGNKKQESFQLLMDTIELF